jgi:hypothetical protein
LVNNANTVTLSTFGDFTKEEGHLFAGSGFGADPASFLGTRETGGHNYSARLNSNIAQNWIGEFAFGLHFQQNNIIPDASVASTALVTDAFAVLRSNGTIAPVTQTGTLASGGASCLLPSPPNPAPPIGCNTGFVDFVFAPGGTLQRNFVQQGFGLYQDQSRDRWEASARLQNIWNDHTIKYGFEFYRNAYDINQVSTGPSNTFANPNNVGTSNGTDADNRAVSGFRVTNNYSVCTTRGTVITCPSSTAIAILQAAATAGTLPAGYTLNTTATTITAAEALNNPFLVRTTTRVPISN